MSGFEPRISGVRIDRSTNLRYNHCPYKIIMVALSIKRKCFEPTTVRCRGSGKASESEKLFIETSSGEMSRKLLNEGLKCFKFQSFLKYGPIPVSFCLFSFFSNSNNNFNNTNWKKRRWCAWDSNPGPQEGRQRRNHGAMAASPCLFCSGSAALLMLIFHQLYLFGRIKTGQTEGWPYSDT